MHAHIVVASTHACVCLAIATYLHELRMRSIVYTKTENMLPG